MSEDENEAPKQNRQLSNTEDEPNRKIGKKKIEKWNPGIGGCHPTRGMSPLQTALQSVFENIFNSLWMLRTHQLHKDHEKGLDRQFHFIIEKCVTTIPRITQG